MKQTLLIVLFLFGLASTSPVLAQERVVVSVSDRALSDELARSALSFLGYGSPGKTDMPQRLAGVLLDEALRLNPNNAQLWKLRVELAQQMADLEVYEKALLAYLRTGVEDDKAQYDLLVHRLSKRNTLDGQYKAIEQLLESQGASRLSDPLRSRLASFAAAAAVELVEPEDQAKWTVEAARLDPSNNEAAEMMYQLVLERGGDVVKQGTGLINIIRARPLAPAPRIELAGVLAGQACFERAAQQYQLAGTRLSKGPLPLEAYRNWAHCLVILGQDTVALRLIEELETALKGDAEQAEAKAVLPVDFEVLRLSTLDSGTDAEAAAQSFGRVRKMLEASGNENAAGQVAVIAAVFGPSLEQAAALAGALPEESEQREVALGWVALRKGDKQAAITHFTPLVKSNTLADCGLAIAGAQDNAGRARELRRILQIAPNSVAAVAAARVLREDGERIDATREGRALTDLMSRYSEGLWLVDVERSPWLDVRLVIQPARFSQTEPIQVEVTIWNTTRFPLGIGEDQPIRPRALLLLTATSAGQPLPPFQPVVIDLGRKLVLEAGQRMTFTTRIDYNQFGSIVAVNPGAGISFDARLIVNPVLNANGAWMADGVGGISIVRDCILQGAANSAAAVEKWLGEVGSEDTPTRLRALSRLALLSKQAQPQIVNLAREQEIRGAITAAWPTLSDSEKAWVVCFANQMEAEASILHSLAGEVKASNSKTLWLAYLSRQVSNADSEMLREAIRRQDMPEVSQFAEAMRRMLRELPKEEAQP